MSGIDERTGRVKLYNNKQEREVVEQYAGKPSDDATALFPAPTFVLLEFKFQALSSAPAWVVICASVP